MKKIIIVNNNMGVGGVQKSLYNLLRSIHDQYDVTLCLFSATGPYMQWLPENIRILQPHGPFRYLGKNQKEWTGIHKWIRGGYALLAKLFGRNVAMKWMLAGERELEENYDCAIAFLHNGNIKNFYGGTQEYVLSKIRARKKVAFLHCDYRNCGANHLANNRLLGAFDAIAACSNGCRRAFETVVPNLADRCIAVPNCHCFDEIRDMAQQDSALYDTQYRNVVMVSRLAHEKGIERAIEAVASCIGKGIPVMLHIVGDGPMRPMLEEKIAQYGISANVRFYGEQANPYRYMKHADLFLMTSFHEAAPMVIEEACCLGVPILTTETTSSHDMVTARDCGWVCDNSQEALSATLEAVLRDQQSLQAIKETLRNLRMNNAEALKQFSVLIEG